VVTVEVADDVADVDAVDDADVVGVV